MADLRRKLMDVVYTKSFEYADKLKDKGYEREKAEEIAENIIINKAIDHLNDLDDEILIECIEGELEDIYGPVNY